jgi:hypothetical protein
MTLRQYGLHLQLDQRRLLELAPEPRADAGGTLGDIDRLVVSSRIRTLWPGTRIEAGFLRHRSQMRCGETGVGALKVPSGVERTGASSLAFRASCRHVSAIQAEKAVAIT